MAPAGTDISPETLRVADDAWTLENLLGQQRELTLVEKFSRKHEAQQVPAQEKYYRDLIPLTTPGPGQQYAFEVNLDTCTGCKACVAACHSLNGLDESESWRDTGLLLGGSEEKPYQQTVTTACHHCLSPACQEGCPVLAYEKDPVTGIVVHLDDQCIGCQYCVLKCPYDVPKYNAKRGIVRKCDMCQSRLKVGEAPACVQACPHQAISIKLISTVEVTAKAEAGVFLPGAPDPGYTLPTTRFKTTKEFPVNLLAGDHDVVRPQDAHLPLVIMLVLTQMSVGGFVVGQLLEAVMGGPALDAVRPVNAATALGLGMIALAASTLHLGRPLYAFRAVLGLRTSWMSREILAFGIFAGLAGAYAAAAWMFPGAGGLVEALGFGVSLSGLAAVFCSMMIYHDTRRVFWDLSLTGFKFGMSLLVLGLSLALLTSLAAAKIHGGLDAQRVIEGWGRALCVLLIAVSLAKMLFELSAFSHLRDLRMTPLKRSAILMSRDLKSWTKARFAFGVLGGILLPALFLILGAGSPALAGFFAFAALSLSLVGELLERFLFFTAVVSPKMPGGVI